MQPWLIWGLGASFFFSEYFARVDPSIITNQLMSYFDVGAYAIGSLSAYFYWPYILMQVPVGSLVDRYGPHRLITGAALLCGSACILFAHAHTIGLAELARALMGFSASFAFVGALKLATLWFEPKKLGLLAGLTQGSGMLGAAVGEGVLAFFVASFGWRQTILLIGIILLVIGVLIGLFVRDRRPTLLSYRSQPEHQHLTIKESLAIVLRNKYSWINAIFVGFLYAPTAAFAELWGPSFMHRAYNISHTDASLMVSFVFLGAAVGGPVLGLISDVLKRRKPLMFFSAIMSGIILFFLLFAGLHYHLDRAQLFALMFLYGVCNMGVGIAYAYAGEVNPLPTAGLSVAFANMASIAIGAALQPVIGWLLDLRWKGVFVDGARYFSVQDYQHAVVILPVCFIVSFFAIFFLKETYCSRK